MTPAELARIEECALETVKADIEDAEREWAADCLILIAEVRRLRGLIATTFQCPDCYGSGYREAHDCSTCDKCQAARDDLDAVSEGDTATCDPTPLVPPTPDEVQLTIDLFKTGQWRTHPFPLLTGGQRSNLIPVLPPSCPYCGGTDSDERGWHECPPTPWIPGGTVRPGLLDSLP